MYFRLSEFYKRDTSFVYDQENNPVNWLKLREGNKFTFEEPLIYNVDKIDNYINQYDILPSIGINLISKKMAKTLSSLIKDEVQLFDTIIKDDNGNENNDFLAINILKILPILDKERAIFEVDEDDYYDIKKFYIKEHSLNDSNIVRMKEHLSYIIVSQSFKDKCEEANLKGIHFMEEGYSIYTDV
ncbi:imm11 family protein [Zobellia laminariae]|uniref:imm11 family protein n=1 Tax=Zobellia laminariae TaxID=248906 RepID=UPI0026F40DDB|nr:DUF1629 domain-containing protein [Zobellia laminariae]WKX76179.1 hypothetical protein Q5W13_21850 [Zobellia laminariae]